METSSSLAVIVCVLSLAARSCSEEVITCSGNVRSESPLDYSQLEVHLLTRSGTLKEQTDCAPNNGYFLIPIYDKGEYVLKVVPPQGWSFEPAEMALLVDGKTDPCSLEENIVFTFSGFPVYGQVTSKGLKTGPAGITMQLRTRGKDATLISEVATEAEGKFVMTGIQVGQYELSMSHPQWTLSKETVPINVVMETVHVPLNKLVVLGYDVKGQIQAQNEPVSGVHFLLYSKSGIKDVDCGSSVNSIHASPSLLCAVSSSATGEFSFKSLPPGDYRLVPHYQNNDLTFEVKPSQVSFSVSNDSVLIEPVFEVHGFSVSGRVVSGEDKDGISGAKVSLGDELTTKTDENGHYQLFNITSGKYKLKVESKGVEFDSIFVDVTPQSPLLPVVRPSRYSVCGKVVITAHITNKKTSEYVVEASSVSSTTTTTTKPNGNFCFMLPPGLYTLKVRVAKGEEDKGMMLLPSVLPVTVEYSVVSDLKFSQFVTVLRGTVECIVKCPPMELSLQRNAQGTAVGKPVIISTTNQSNKKKATFEFSNLLPGTYTVSISHQLWCWSMDSHSVTVATKQPPPIVFSQKGFLLHVSSSHSTSLDLSIKNKTISTVGVQRGRNELCLEKPGVYKLVPSSCHHFEAPFYTYDISSPSPVTLTAISHTVTATVVSTVESKDTRLSLDFAGSEDKQVVLEPSSVTAPTKPSQDFIYSFSFDAKPGISVTVSPQSSVLICTPTKLIHTVAEDCPEEVPPFQCSPGLFIQGRVDPPLVDVAITVTVLGEDGQNQLLVFTDKKGHYKAGPIHGSAEHTVEAHKPQHAFEPFPDDKYSFRAMKFSQLTITVEDETTRSPLVGVLVSITRDKMRSNNYTKEDGSITFSNLVPGEYYVKPLLREYKFSPSSNLVLVKQGDAVVKAFTARRVAFTCSGRTTSLNKMPLSGVTVAALGATAGSDSCQSYKEETVSDGDGNFHFRGLMPDCSYKISVVQAETRTVERALPPHRTVQISGGDVGDQDFIVFYQHITVTVTGNVVTDLEFIHTLKVLVFDDEVHLDSPVYSTGLDSAGFFDIPSLPLNTNKTYTVSLETSLSSHLYRIDTGSRVDLVVGSDKHITLHFDATPLEMESETSRGSLIGVILAVGVVFALANFDKVIGVAQPYIMALLSLNGDGGHNNGNMRRGR